MASLAAGQAPPSLLINQSIATHGLPGLAIAFAWCRPCKVHENKLRLRHAEVSAGFRCATGRFPLCLIHAELFAVFRLCDIEIIVGVMKVRLRRWHPSGQPSGTAAARVRLQSTRLPPLSLRHRQPLSTWISIALTL